MNWYLLSFTLIDDIISEESRRQQDKVLDEIDELLKDVPEAEQADRRQEVMNDLALSSQQKGLRQNIW